MQTTSIALATMTETIRRAIARYPEQAARIKRGATIVALGQIARTGPETWSVKSQSRPDTYYVVTVTGDSLLAVECACEDARRHPGQQCLHQWAVSLTLVAEERQRRLDAAQAAPSWRERFAVLTDEEIGRLSAWKRRYVATPA